MSAKPGPRPANITPFPNGEIGIVWEDGHESYYDSYRMRCSCPCAGCVDEVTGKKILRDETVLKDVRPESIHPVGHYGISIRWSDGHDTGIYRFDALRRNCPCETCSGS
jgi:DUF971 family protein